VEARKTIGQQSLDILSRGAALDTSGKDTGVA
jgi:hypothetical protein